MQVGVLLFHRVGDLESVGAASVFHAARRFLATQQAPEVSTVARSRFSVQTVAGLTITPSWAFASAPQYQVLVVPGGRGVDGAAKDPAVASFLASQRPGLRVLAGVSSGVLLLGVLGYLRDQEATTHPEVLDQLPAFEVARISDERVVRNPSGVWCAAGPAAGIELALAVLAESYGSEIAEATADFLSHPCWPPASQVGSE